MENVVPTWEASKENVLPLKRGRSVKGLSKALESNAHASDLLTQEQSFEQQIEETKKSSDKERLLKDYLAYFKWMRDAYPSNHEKALKILEVSEIISKSNGYTIAITDFLRV
jgi:hypothetical protein